MTNEKQEWKNKVIAEIQRKATNVSGVFVSDSGTAGVVKNAILEALSECVTIVKNTI